MPVAKPKAPTAHDWSECLTQSASRVETKQGVVEYAERGEGPALLSVHGSPGGYEQGLLLAEHFRVNGFRVIAPSRPGYGGTPLDTGRTCAEQADAMAALMDALGIDHAAVLGASGGGPSSYLLAARHPDRVRCLVEVDSICLPLPPSRVERLGFSRPMVALQLWLVDHFPGPLLKLMGGTGTTDPEDAVSFLRAIILSARLGPERRAGYDNDEAQFASLGALPLAAVSCPVLIVHGTADRSVPGAHAEHAHTSIIGSELQWLANGGHLSYFFDLEVQHHALAWTTSRLGP